MSIKSLSGVRKYTLRIDVLNIHVLLSYNTLKIRYRLDADLSEKNRVIVNNSKNNFTKNTIQTFQLVVAFILCKE